MASPYKTAKGTRWRVRWYDDNGEQKQKAGFLTAKEADAYGDQMRQEVADEDFDWKQAARNTTVEQFLVRWWERYVSKKLTKSTRENYKVVIETLILPYIGNVTMMRMRAPGRVAQWRDKLEDDGVPLGQVSRAMTVFSSALGKAAGDYGLLDRNPVYGVTKPTEPPSEERRWALSPEEIELMRAEFLTYRAPNSTPLIALRSATIVSLGGHAGLRTEEWMGLRVKRILWDEKMLVIRDVHTAGEFREEDTKTHAPRLVGAEDALLEDLKVWIDVGLPLWLGRPVKPGDHLFPDEKREVTSATHRNWAARPWKRARNAVVRAHPDLEDSLGEATPRDLRSARVSLLARAGWSDADIADDLGHSPQVLNRYYKLSIRRLRGLPTMPAAKQIAKARREVGTPALTAAVIAELREPRKQKFRLIVGGQEAA